MTIKELQELDAAKYAAKDAYYDAKRALADAEDKDAAYLFAADKHSAYVVADIDYEAAVAAYKMNAKSIETL